MCDYWPCSAPLSCSPTTHINLRISHPQRLSTTALCCLRQLVIAKMASQSSSSHPRLASAATPQLEIYDDQDDSMPGSDFEAEQPPIHRSSAATSFTSATRRRAADVHAKHSPSSSASLLTTATGQNVISANALRVSTTPRRTHRRAGSLSEDSATGLSSAGPSHSESHSPSSPFSAGSGDEEEEDEYLPGDSQDEDEGADGTQRGTASIQLRAQAASASTSPIGQNRYTNDEDSLLQDAVKQHGTRWKEVSNSYNKQSTGITRSPGALKMRWETLLKRGKVQPVIRARQSKVWTNEEVNVLLRSLRRHQGQDVSRLYNGVCSDFRQAFPQSTRSYEGISSKCRALAKQSAGQSNNVSRPRPSASSLVASRVPTSSSTPLRSPVPATRGRLLVRNQGGDRVSVQTSSTESPIDCDDPVASLTVRGEGPFISPPAAASKEGNASTLRRRSKSQRQPQPQQQIERHRPQGSAEPHDVNVLMEQNSVCIENCRRDFHVAVYSETLVKITREAPPPAVIAFGRSYEPAFHFHVLATGSIRALRLPEDTTTSVTPVPASESSDGGAYVDTTFLGPDSYLVLFRSRL